VLEVSEQFSGLLMRNIIVSTLLPVCHALEGHQATADRYFDALSRKLEDPVAARARELGII
jgi:hypothetical protein